MYTYNVKVHLLTPCVMIFLLLLDTDNFEHAVSLFVLVTSEVRIILYFVISYNFCVKLKFGNCW